MLMRSEDFHHVNSRDQIQVIKFRGRHLFTHLASPISVLKQPEAVIFFFFFLCRTLGIIVLVIQVIILEIANKIFRTILESIADLIKVNQSGIKSRGFDGTR